MKKMWNTILGEVVKAIFTLGLSLLRKGKKYHVEHKDIEHPQKDNTKKKADTPKSECGIS